MTDPRDLRPDPAAAGEVRDQIARLVREGRYAKGLTQARLAQLVHTSRFTINRLERANTNLTRALAERLEEALEVSGLISLVARRAQLPAAAETERDLIVRNMLDQSGLEKVTIVATDDLDIYSIVFDDRRDAPLEAREMRVVFPTVAREAQLFGPDQPLYGWIEYQIKRLSELQTIERYSPDRLKVYESDEALTSCVITSTRSSATAAFWPPIAVDGQVRGANLPVVTTVDPEAVGRLEAYADALTRGLEPLKTNRALSRVTTLPAGEPTEETFTRFYGQGIDQEEDVAEDEGFAVALVLVVALCTRQRHGLGRRIVTYERPTATRDRERLSLFSSNVEDADIRAARAFSQHEPAETARSTYSALAAALDVDPFLRSRSNVVPDIAYQYAAVREFSMFDLSITPERLTRRPLPAEMQLIEKGKEGQRRRAAIAPRLYILELAAGPKPELDTLRFAADIKELGTVDLAQSDELNDFLMIARERGFLGPLLEELDVAPQ
jgi:transcriptional regulator with XRE-family HTH domain